MSTAAVPVETSSLPPYAQAGTDGTATMRLSAPDMHCAGCMGKIERGLSTLAGVGEVRTNLSSRRVFIRFDPATQSADQIRQALGGLGFENTPLDPALEARTVDARSRSLLRALAVAGFATANIMLLSVAVWSGSDMDDSTRAMFHWLSALIALPAIAYAGLPFFTSAVTALRARQMNMDVPISLAVILSAGMSLFETIRDAGAHTYFDAAVMLLFFLLIGRTLDERMRARAASAVQDLVSFLADTVELRGPDGATRTVAVSEIRLGDLLHVPPGTRIALDGEVVSGAGEVDASLLTGEAAPESVGPGDAVFAGTLSLNGALTVRVTALREDTVLADIVRLTEAAERNRGRYVQLADMAARLYVPVVHTLALLTFGGWWWISGSVLEALTHAVAVLIITCPCALGLAVPVVQIVAVGSLFRRGALVKSGDAVERLAQADTVVFDKTGTLTTGVMALDEEALPDREVCLRAAALAAESHHPLSRSLAARFADAAVAAGDVRETRGMGLEGTVGGVRARLGRASWVLAGEEDASTGAPAGGAETPEETRSVLYYREDGGPVHRFAFRDSLRPEIPEVIAALKAKGYALHLLSGDHAGAVGAVARELGIDHWRGDCHPGDKVAELEALKAAGATTVMVGDGLNDAPSLRAAHASISPASAADIARTAADVVLPGNGLAVVPDLLRLSRRARGLMLGNFGLAAVYNMIAVPVAVVGLVTPLVAALAMSGSSIVVTLNALRLKMDDRVTVRPHCPGSAEERAEQARAKAREAA